MKTNTSYPEDPIRCIEDQFPEEVKATMNVFYSMESELDKTLKQNEILNDRLLEETLAEDVRNLVITSCVEIKNKNLREEIASFLKESKDVSNVYTFRNDASDVTEELVETNQCDKDKVKFDFDEIETQNIEFEHQVASLLKENEHLKLVYKNLFDSIKKSRVQVKSSNITQNEAGNLTFDVSEVMDNKIEQILGNMDSFPSLIAEGNISELEKESGEKKNIFENAKCELQTKIIVLEKVLTQQTKDFDDIQLELSNRTAKSKRILKNLKMLRF
ncbi:hypothetical protein Tco_0218477 [Tanacetum coccineum]